MRNGIHFISGLPRSGSTLLAALLRQNPRFQAGMSGPLAGMFGALLSEMSARNEFSIFIDDAKRERIRQALARRWNSRSGGRPRTPLTRDRIRLLEELPHVEQATPSVARHAWALFGGKSDQVQTVAATCASRHYRGRIVAGAMFAADDGQAVLVSEGVGLPLQQALQGAFDQAGSGGLGDALQGGQIEGDGVVAGASGDDFAPLGGEVVEFLQFGGGEVGAWHGASCLWVALEC